MNMNLKKIASDLPDKPGIYIFRDMNGSIIYVGKAVSLKKRVSSYFHGRMHDPKTGTMIGYINSLEYQLAPTELEALMLESSLIKKYRPKYNVMYKDDKAYPFLKLTVHEEFPRLSVTRRILPDHARYFGPYVSAGPLRKMQRAVFKSFPIRDCMVDMKKPLARPCLKADMKFCSAPCVGRISKEEYRALTEKLIAFLEGKQRALESQLREKMMAAASKDDFEKAAQIKHQWETVHMLALQADSKLRYARTAKAEVRDILVRKGFVELKEQLSLPAVPRRIDAFDISNIQGENAYGSMAVFIDGSPDTNLYRVFKIKTVDQSDDFAMMRK